MILYVNSFACGILLGAAFLHSLPDAIAGITDTSYPYHFLIAGSTLLFLLFVSSCVCPLLEAFSCFGDNGFKPQALVSANSFWASLLIHGCFEGLAVGGLTDDSRWVVLGTLFVHKIVEYSALAATLQSGGLAVDSYLFWATAGTSELPCIVCFIVSWMAVSQNSVISDTMTTSGLFAALSAGTFIYLSLGHLYPECTRGYKSHSHSHYAPGTTPAPAVDSGIEATQLEGTVLQIEMDKEEKGENGASASKLPDVMLPAVSSFFIGLGWMVFALLALSHEGAQGAHGESHGGGH